MDWSLAQRLPTKWGPEIWAVPAEGLVCLVSLPNSESVATVCDTVVNVQRHGLAISFLSANTVSEMPTRIIVGMAPDGTRHVTEYSRDSTVQLEVSNGIFELQDFGRDPPEEFRLVPHVGMQE